MRSSLLLLPILALLGASELFAAEPIPPFEPNPAIWKMADDDTEIYMLGTIHALPPELKWRSTALDGIIEKVDELVVETNDPESKDLSPVLAKAMLDALDRKPLLDRIDPKNRSTLQGLVKQLGLSMDYLDLVPTWMVSFVMFYNGADTQGVSADYGVETVLERLFKKAKKPIGQIESSAAVDSKLNALSDAEQLVSLNEMLTEYRTSPNASLLPDPKANEHPHADDIAWAKGDISKIGDDMTPKSMGSGYYRVLLVDRNAAWTEWLQARMAKPGKILLAVGAGHLAGPDSVQTMLAKKGIKIERIH
jgi:uncharacterized protein